MSVGELMIKYPKIKYITALCVKKVKESIKNTTKKNKIN